jgi:hypothetical protein
MAGMLPQQLSGRFFDNGEGGYTNGHLRRFVVAEGDEKIVDEERIRKVSKSISDSIQELLNHGHRVVLVYPIPEAGWMVPDKLRQLLGRMPIANRDKWLKETGLTTSYARFQERVRSAYALYDSIPANPNLLRIFPEKLFCNTIVPGRCVTHFGYKTYYSDESHLSYYGVDLLTDVIVKGINDHWSVASTVARANPSGN